MKSQQQISTVFVCLFVCLSCLISQQATKCLLVREEQMAVHVKTPLTCTLLDCRRNQTTWNSRNGDRTHNLLAVRWQYSSMHTHEKPETIPATSDSRSLYAGIVAAPRLKFLINFFSVGLNGFCSKDFTVRLSLIFFAMSVMRVEAVWRPLPHVCFSFFVLKPPLLSESSCQTNRLSRSRWLLNMCLPFAAMPYFKMLYYIFPFVLFAPRLTSLWLSIKCF